MQPETLVLTQPRGQTFWSRLRERLVGPASTAPRWSSRLEAEIEIPLNDSFRFAHEPVETASRPSHFVGREADLDTLVQRILFSDGGSFLVTGYRGVGKTSFVNQVIHRMREVMPRLAVQIGRAELVDVHLALARSVSGGELMHHIIRRLHDRLQESGQWHRVPHPVREDLRLAYRRTSMNVTQKMSETNERSFGVSEAGMSRALAGAFKLLWTQKLTRAKGDEATFLGYDDKAAENDVLRIARRLTAAPRRKWWQVEAPKRLKIVFIFDELDKMEDPAAASATPRDRPLDQILASLKNLFTTSGISFLFVAGKDLHERWLEDIGRGDSIYESVFCFDKYLPCLWQKTEAICRCFVNESELRNGGSGAEAAFHAFERYLHYKGRGIPRRIIREFNQYVVWRGSRAVLAFDKQDIRRFRFYAELQELLETRSNSDAGLSRDESQTTRSDKERLGMLYLVDWILARGRHDFTADDAVSASYALSTKIAPAKEIAPAVIGDLIAFLVQHEYLVEVKNDAATVLGPVKKPAQYRLATRRIAELGETPVDIPEVKDVVAFHAPLPASEAHRFINMERVGSGGMGDVYRAWDTRHGRFVALKMLAIATEEALLRFEREAKLLASLHHQNIVQFYEFLRAEGETARPAIVMEYIDGTSLRAILRSTPRIDPPIAVAIMRQIVRPVAYVHGLGIIRNDLKPDNVLVSRDGRLLISDFGIAKWTGNAGEESPDEITANGVIIGTPSYMAPEQAQGLRVDARADVYSLGSMLFEMITSNPPFGRVASPQRYLMRLLQEAAPRASEFAEVPPALDDLIARCLERDPDDRFESAWDLLDALDALEGVSDTQLAQVLDKGVASSEREKSKRDRVTLPFSLRIVTGAAGDVAMSTMAVPTPPRLPMFTQVESGPVLRITAPPSLEGMMIAIARRLRIGRSDEAEFRIDSTLVSRLHAEVVRQDDGFSIKDLNSANGTRVDGEQIRQRVRLRNGARIEIGDVEMVFEIREQRRAPEAA